MNNKIKILISIFLLFPVFVFADDILYTWESGSIANVEFINEDNGKVFIDNQLIFDGFPSGDVIDGVVTYVLPSGNYIEICNDLCTPFFWDKQNLIELSTGTKGFVSVFRELDRYILFITNIPESLEWTIAIYDKELDAQVGTRYFDNIDISDVYINDSNLFIIETSGEQEIVPVSSFTENSLRQDNILAREKRNQKQYPQGIFYILGFSVLFLAVVIVRKKQKTKTT